jgi:hypothetical protein
MEMVSVQMQTWRFQVSLAHSTVFQLYIFVLLGYLENFPFAHFIISALMEQIELQGNRFNVVLEYDENEMLEFYEEGLIQKEFEEHLSFKISSPATHRICGFNLFTWFSATPISNPYLHVYPEIRNNTKGRVNFQLKNLNCYGSAIGNLGPMILCLIPVMNSVFQCLQMIRLFK